LPRRTFTRGAGTVRALNVRPNGRHLVWYENNLAKLNENNFFKLLNIWKHISKHFQTFEKRFKHFVPLELQSADVLTNIILQNYLKTCCKNTKAFPKVKKN
jgi:hypothetical protein